VARPDGSVVELVPTNAEAGSVAFAATELPGIYLVTPHLAAGAPSAPSGVAGSAVPSRAPVDPNAPVRFAVDLFDVNESTIAPGSAASIEALGRAPSASSPSTTGSAPTARPTARDELWIPIVLVVLATLCIEWAIYQRDAVVRLRRGLAARLGRRPGDELA
jgi:hypothetical protein